MLVPLILFHTPAGSAVPTLPLGDAQRGQYCGNAGGLYNRYIDCPNSACCPISAGLSQSDVRCSWDDDSCYRPVLDVWWMAVVYWALQLLWGVLWCCYVCSARGASGSGGRGQAAEQRQYARMSEVVQMS